MRAGSENRSAESSAGPNGSGAGETAGLSPALRKVSMYCERTELSSSFIPHMGQSSWRDSLVVQAERFGQVLSRLNEWAATGRRSGGRPRPRRDPASCRDEAGDVSAPV